MPGCSGRSLRGNVDRNRPCGYRGCRYPSVVPYVGTWIEIVSGLKSAAQAAGRSLRGNVDRNNFELTQIIKSDSRSLRGNVNRNC